MNHYKNSGALLQEPHVAFADMGLPKSLLHQKTEYKQNGLREGIQIHQL